MATLPFEFRYMDRCSDLTSFPLHYVMFSSLISKGIPSVAMQPASPPLVLAVGSSPVGLKTLATLDGSLKLNCVKRNYAAFISNPLTSLPSDDPTIEAADDEREAEEVVEDYVDDEDDVDLYGDMEDGGDEEDTGDTRACWATYGKGRPSCRLPPPIPLLARTGNLTCHMPWVLKRIYKEDGSLVLREERVKHHEYFRAHRENGRLTLQLVEVDDRSPLLVSGRKRCEDDEENESQYYTDQEDFDDGDAVEASQDLHLSDHDGVKSCVSTPAKGMDTMRAGSSWASPSPSPSPSMTVLSTSMPEPLCGKKLLERGSPIGRLRLLIREELKEKRYNSSLIPDASFFMHNVR